MKKRHKKQNKNLPTNKFLSETNKNDVSVSVRIKGKTKRIKLSWLVRVFKKIRDLFAALWSSLVSFFSRGK